MNRSVVTVVAVLTGALIGIGVVWGVLTLLERDNHENNAHGLTSVVTTPSRSNLETDNNRSSRAEILLDITAHAELPFEFFFQKEAIVTWVTTLNEKGTIKALDDSISPDWNVSRL